MTLPVSRLGGFRRIAAWYVRECKSWYGAGLIAPILTTALPAVLVALAHPSSRDQLSKMPSVVSNLVGNYPAIVGVLAVLYVILLKAIHAGIERLAVPERELSREEVARLVAQLDKLTDVRTIRLVSTPPKSSLHVAMNDGQQTLSIIGAVHGYMSALKESSGPYRVHLLRVKNGAPSDWVAAHPSDRPPRTQAAALNNDDSTAMLAIKTQRIQIVESTRTKNIFGKSTPYVVSPHGEDEKGSLICYPITSPKTMLVKYVLCIASNKDYCFLRKHDELYTWVLDKFGRMIQQEIALCERKEK